jgi:hypothetical protein
VLLFHGRVRPSSKSQKLPPQSLAASPISAESSPVPLFVHRVRLLLLTASISLTVPLCSDQK